MKIFQILGFQLKDSCAGFLGIFVPKDTSYKYALKNNRMTSCCTLNISAETEKKKAAINDKLKEIVIKHIDNPEKLVQYMQTEGLNVYNVKNADKLLSYLGEEEGFISPQKGIDALILSLIICLFSKKKFKIGFSTEPLFVFSEQNTEIYTIARALHKYYGYKNQLPGFDYKTQKLFKKIYNSRHKTSKPFGNCTVAQMYACKEALRRDMESIDFSIQISIETEGAKNALKKIKDKSSAKV